jgi:hypothetical protein
MARFTILIGLLLTLVGVGSYFYALLTVGDANGPSPTALIPAFAGVPILLLGCVALKESLRKHAMHIVALLALLGFPAPGRAIGHEAGSRRTSQDDHTCVARAHGSIVRDTLGCLRTFVCRRPVAQNSGLNVWRFSFLADSVASARPASRPCHTGARSTASK